MENKLTPVRKVRLKNISFKKEIFSGIFEMIRLLKDWKNGITPLKKEFKKIEKPPIKKGRPPLEVKEPTDDPKEKKNLGSRIYRKKVNQENSQILSDYNWLVDQISSKKDNLLIGENVLSRLKIIEDRISNYIPCSKCGFILKKQGLGKHEKLSCQKAESNSQVSTDIEITEIQQDQNITYPKEQFCDFSQLIYSFSLNQKINLATDAILKSKHSLNRKLTDFVQSLHDKELIESDMNGIKYFKEKKTDTLRLSYLESINHDHMEIALEYLKFRHKDIKMFNHIDKTLRFDNTDNLILSLNAGKNYWATITNINTSNKQTKNRSIFVYDCNNSIEVIDLVKPYLREMFPEKEFLMIEFVDMRFMERENTNDSGLFSLAYLKALCEQKEPSLIDFDQLSMRNQYNKFIQNLDKLEFNELRHVEGKRRTKLVEIMLNRS